MGRRGYGFEPTAADLVREAAEREAGGNVTLYAQQQAERARAQTAVRDAERRAGRQFQEVPDLLKALEYQYATQAVDEPEHTTPAALAARDRSIRLQSSLEEGYGENAPTIDEADRNPRRPDQFVAVGEVALTPDYGSVDDGMFNTFQAIQGLPVGQEVEY